jgi:hypothetical protein
MTKCKKSIREWRRIDLRLVQKTNSMTLEIYHPSAKKTTFTGGGSGAFVAKQQV